ncbi:uncharacterized protein YcnI [Microbacterium sp. AK009]|uniref:DUF1775 domain-containing protein n=1 Tax=Microbacterium sp. AK009 TaxID=2723068 RepID=UPI0015CCBEC8|nr:DUF1775 domain-containing protein [Microbacterium sp. AK009]NYF15980.1 uncharacterized protein YcnI [Microbacterium sp. AK009]
MTTSTSARLPLVAAGSVIGVALVLAAPLAASAHVGVSPEVAPAGTRTTLQFSFSHGCDDSPTTSLTVDIPDAVATVAPVVDGEWTISREVGADGVPTQVTFTADDPIDTGLRASVAIDVTFAEASAGDSVAFPVEQTCVTGSTAWNEVTEPGEEERDHPAPVVVVSEPDEGDASGHGAAHADDPQDAAATPVAASSTGGDDPVARGLAAASLVTGAGALVAALWRRRARS